jgi:hypothetical protein
MRADSDRLITDLPPRARARAGAAVAVREARHPPGRVFDQLIGKSSREITYMLAQDSMAEREKR